MRIALDYTSEIGVRAGKLLMGEEELELLGVLRREVKDRDPRIRRVESITGFDAVMTDDPESSVVAEAITDGIPCVLWADTAVLPDDRETATVLVGANLVEGIGRSLLARETAGPTGTSRSLFAWTEPGKPLRRGEAVTFPDPVGARWGSLRRSTGDLIEIAVPVPDEWAGVLVSTTDDDTTGTIAIADLATHLEGIALAAGAVVTAGGAVPAGVHTAPSFALSYLDAAVRIGLDMASFTAEN